MRLKWAPPDPENEELQHYYDFVGSVSEQADTAEAKERRRQGGSLFHTFSLRPDVGYHILQAVRLGHFDEDGFLSPALKQAIATYASALRSCVF